MPKEDAGRHLSYFRLRDAMRSPGCPVCRQADDAVDGALRSLLHEQVNDDATRTRIVESNGFCHEHAWRLAGRSDALGTALIHRDLVVRLRRRVGAGRGSEVQRRPCLMCEVRDDAAARAVATLVQHVDDAALRAAFAASDGLCAAHFARAMDARGARRETLERIAAIEDDCLARLESELSELIRKFDYRFREEPRRAESTSWIRAVATISGLDTTRLPAARPASFPPPRRRPD